MSADDEKHGSARAGPEHFATTHWSLVLAAGRRSLPQSQAALAALCESYWYPIYAYIRRRGHAAQEAEDLTQSFFARLLANDDLAGAKRERGKFRSFLLTSLKNFLANEWDRAQAKKRGGGRPIASLDVDRAESRYAREPGHSLTAETIYERRWALVLLEQVLSRLQEESSRAGKAELFECLKVFLTGEKGAASYAQTAAELKMTEGAVKVAVHRLRRRYRELLRAEIGQTVADPEEIDDEIRELFAAVGS